MQQIKTLKTGWYIFSDVLASIITWIFITHKRKVLQNEEPLDLPGLFINDSYFYKSILITVIFWIILYAVAGAYNVPPYKKSRLKELTGSFIQCLIGSLILLFILFFNDKEQHYTYFYIVFFMLLLLQTFLVCAGRLMLITFSKNDVKKKPQLFNTIIIGNSAKAVAVYNEIKRNYKASGYNLLGFVTDDNFLKNGISKSLPCLGTIEEAEVIIQAKNVSQVVIALEKSERRVTETLISQLSGHDVDIKMVPDTLAILTGSVKVNNVPGAV